MNVKNIINLLSVALNMVLIFPLLSQGALTAIYGIYLEKEAFLDYYSEILVILPVSSTSVVLFGVILPLILSQLAATFILRQLYSYITKPERDL